MIEGKKRPLVSIITPSYNQGQFIEETILSVLGQDYPNIEYIVIDGRSTDNTLEILKKYGNKIKWISELDKGQSDAINKGFRMAKGQILGWLNSDDTYLPGAVSKVVDYLVSHHDVMMVYGDGYEIDEYGRILQRFPATQRFDLWKLIYIWDYILQPTVFFRKEMLDEVGFLDINLKWCMDWDMWMRIGKKFRINYLPTFLANSRIYGKAKTSTGGIERFKEIANVMRNHGDKKFPPGYFIYGQDTLETLVKTKAPYLYNLFFKYILTLVRQLLAKMIHGSQGVYPDGWVSRRSCFLLPIYNGIGNLTIRGDCPLPFPEIYPLTIMIKVEKDFIKDKKIKSTGEFNFVINIPSHLFKNNLITVSLHADKAFVPYKQGLSKDRRKLSFRLEQIEFR